MTQQLQSSLIIGTIIAFFQRYWPSCLCKRVLDALEVFAARTARNSFFCRVLRRESRMSQQWSESLFCRFFSWVIHLPERIMQVIYGRWGNVLESSFCLRLIARMGGSVHIWLGSIFALMLVVPHALWNNAYAFALVVALLGLFIFGCGRKKEQSLQLVEVGPYLVIYMIFICGAYVSSLNSGLSFRFLLFHLTSFLVVLLALSAVKNLKQLTTMISIPLAGLTVAGLYGMAQGIVGVDVVASQQDLTLNAGMPGRIPSFFDNPNNFAEILVMLLPLFLALFLNAKSFRGKALALIGAAPCIVSLGMTYSRSGWIGAVLAIIVFLALQNWRFIPLGIMGIIVLIPFLPETIWNRILTIGNMEDSSTKYRFAIYDATENLMKDHWLSGVGLGSDVMTDRFIYYPTMYDGNHPIHTHNNYLQMWGETGIFGLISFLALLLYQLKSGIKSIYTANKQTKYILSAALGAFVGILVISLAEYTWFYPRNMFIFWFLFGIIGCCIKLARNEMKTAK